MTDLSTSILEFGDFRFDIVRRELRREGTLVALTPKVLDTLRVLLLNSGEIISKDHLMNEVWGEAFVEESGLMRNISILRKALGEQAGDVPYIVTVPRQGYRFLASVRSAGEPFEGHISIRERTRTRIIVEESDVVSERRTLAVLPFRVSGKGGSMGDLGLAIADALITKLTNIRELIVRPTSSIIKFKEGEFEVASAAADLDVDSIIEGSLWQVGDQVRATVQLVSVPDSKTLWAEVFDGPGSDIFAIQDRISKKVAEALELHLSDGERSQLSRHGTESLEAFRLYAKALFHIHKFSPKHAELALPLLERAIEIDPDYAEAHSCILGCYLQQASLGVIGLNSVSEKGRYHASKAMQIDPHLPDAHYAIGSIALYFDLDLEAAGRSFKRALELRPNDGSASKHYGMYLFLAGRFEESIERAKYARELDPVTPSSPAHIGFACYYGRRFEESIGWHRIALEMEPDFVNSKIGIAWSFAKIGAFTEALASIHSIHQSARNEPNVIAARGLISAAAGDRKSAKKDLNELIRSSKRGLICSIDISAIYGELGEADLAFDRLEAAFAERSLWLIFLRVNPRFDSIRNDPRFDELLGRFAA